MKYRELKDWILKNCKKDEDTYYYNKDFSFDINHREEDLGKTINIYSGDIFGWEEDGLIFFIATVYENDSLDLNEDEHEAFYKLKAIMLDTELKAKPKHITKERKLKI